MDTSRRIRFSIEGFGDYDVAVGTPLNAFLRDFTSDAGIRLASEPASQSHTPGTAGYPTAFQRVRFPPANTKTAAAQISNGSSLPNAPHIAGRWPFVTGTHLDLESATVLHPPLGLRDTASLFEPHALVTDLHGFSIKSVSEVPGFHAQTNTLRFGVRSAIRLTRVNRQSRLPRLLRAVSGVFYTILAYTVGITAKDGLAVTTGVGKATVYEVRDGISRPTDTTQEINSSASPLGHEGSQTKPKFPVLSTLIPLGMSVILATIMKQPLFLLFALSSPILMIAQYLASARANEDQEPRWVASGLVARTLIDYFLVVSAFNSTGAVVPTAHGPATARSLSSHARGEAMWSEGSIHTTSSLQRSRFPEVVQELLNAPHSDHVTRVPESQQNAFRWLRWLPLKVEVHSTPMVLGQGTTTSDRLLRGHRSTLAPTLSNAGSVPTTYKQANVDCYPFSSLEELCARVFAEQWRLRDNHSTKANRGAHLPNMVPFSARLSDNVQPAGLPAPLGASRSLENQSGFELCLGTDESADIKVDLDKTGPHMLVAGTTGSGKSELLQAMIFDAALRYSAKELNLVLFDYKGGAGLGQAAKLPHCAGMVTDLDPTQVPRALDGLTAELHRREELFSDAGVVNLAGYNSTQGGDAHLPRVLIVVDEFRAIVDDHQDFVQRIVRLASQGRSLGLYLVLATQRPAGAITPDIRANIPIRVCLRVADEQDSIDVLGTKDAAYLPQSAPGRFLVSTGAVHSQLGQSYYLGAASSVARVYRPLDRWQRPIHVPEASAHNAYAPETCAPGTPTMSREGNSAVDSIIQLLWQGHRRGAGLGPSSHDPLESEALTSAVAPASPLWAGPLPQVFAPDAAGNKATLNHPTALAALPRARFLTQLVWSDQPGNLLIQGPPHSGKTTALIACARANAPENTLVGIHWIGSPRDRALVQQHVAQAGHDLVNFVDATDPVQMHAMLLALLNSEDPSATRRNVLLIDNFDSVRDTLEAFNRGSGITILEAVLRSAHNAGTRVAVSTSRNAGMQFRNQFIQHLVLASGDCDLDASFGVPRKLLPLPAVKGRAVWTTPEHSFHCQVSITTFPEHYASSSGAVASKEDPFGDLRVVSLEAIASSNDEEVSSSRLVVGPLGHPLSDMGPRNIAIVDNDYENRLWASQTLCDTTIDCSGSDALDRLLDALRNAETTSEGSARTTLWLKNLSATAPHQEPPFRELLSSLSRCGSVTVLVDCSLSEYAQAFRGLLADALSHSRILLLQPRFGIDKDFAGTSITTAVELAQFPGKAVFIENGYAYPARVLGNGRIPQ